MYRPAHFRENDPAALAAFIDAHPLAVLAAAWYPTKAETGEVVPTWNYSVVHAHGRITFTQDPVWLRALVEALTNRHEGVRAVPWKVSDAPSGYLNRMLASIVGFEIVVERLEGKFKSSQNRTERERAGVVKGLTADGDTAEMVAQIVRS